MPRTLTSINRAHPHYRLKSVEESAYNAYRRLSRDQIKAVCAQSGIDPSLNRTQILNVILEKVRAAFKRRWREQTGWDFDDIYDEAKLAQHVREDMPKLQKAERDAAEAAKEASSLPT